MHATGEEGEYLSRLIAYVHLNPVRAGLVKLRDGLDRYPWCSLQDYVKPSSKRCRWVRKHALVEIGWLSQRLAMGARSAVSRTMGQAREHVQADRKAKAIARRLEGLISRR